jgi:hypothetical protein
MLKTSLPGKDDATLRPNPPTFERSGDRRPGLERKSLDLVAKSGDLAIKRQATWGMSADAAAGASDIMPATSAPRERGRVTDVIISAADSGYFPLLQGLIGSLRAQPRSRRLPLVVLDVGLADADRQWLAGRDVGVVAASLPPLATFRDGQPVLSVAQRLRPHLPRLVPGFDVYLWMDADLWVQRDDVVPTYLGAAARGAMAITPELHVTYRSHYSPQRYRRMFRALETLFDTTSAKALAGNPTINSGCFAVRGDARHWQLWDETLAAILTRSSSYYAEQFALNHVLYRRHREARSLFLPAAYNWICHQSMPMIDHRSGALCEPVPPYATLGVVHMTVGSKEGEPELRRTDGTVLRRSLRYPGSVG